MEARLLDGKVAIITGASYGMGRSMAELFAEEGASVVITARHQEKLDEVVDAIKAKGGKAVGVVADVCSTADTKKVFGTALDTFGDVDIPFEEAIHICYGLGMTPMAAGDNRVPVLNWDGHFGEPFYTYTYSCNAAEVEVDLDTGSVYLVKMIGSHDMGRAINPTMAEGQIYGGMAMALGMAVMEDLGHNPKTSAIKNLNLENYLLPTAMDLGETVPIIDAHPDPRSASGGRSLGEPATENGAAAIACAINHALGKPGCIHQLPADLDRVFFAANPPAGKEGR